MVEGQNHSLSGKKCLLDTNILIDYPSIFFDTSNTHLSISMISIEELDSIKHKSASAREAIRNIEELSKMGSLREGVLLGNGNIVRLLASYGDLMTPDVADSNDNMLISEAERFNLCFVTNDIVARIKARERKVETIPYIDQGKSEYTGYTSIDVLPDTIDEFYRYGYVSGTEYNLMPNQYVVLRDVFGSSKSALGRFDEKENAVVSLKVEDGAVWGVDPKNKEQRFAMDALMNEDIPLVTLSGIAGSGKTYLTLAVALHKVLELGQYDKIFIVRPNVPLGRPIGFEPGTKLEKMISWIAGMTDNLEQLLGDKDAYMDYISKGMIEVEALTYLRGRSLNNAFIIIDEAQNMDRHEVKTVLTRTGEGSKIVLLGDVSQVDSPHLNEENNGLSYVVGKFEPYSLAAHVTLKQGVRHPLASLAAEIL